MSFRSVGEVIAAREQEWEDWLHSRRIGRVFYLPKLDVIEFDIRGGYQFGLDQLATAEQFAHWLFHLEEKNWFDAELLKEFLQCLRNVIAERYGTDPRTYFGGAREV